MSNRVKALVAVVLLGSAVYWSQRSKDGATQPDDSGLGESVADLGSLIATADLSEEDWADIAQKIDMIKEQLNG